MVTAKAIILQHKFCDFPFLVLEITQVPRDDALSLGAQKVDHEAETRVCSFPSEGHT